jgi:hypothetical protein
VAAAEYEADLASLLADLTAVQEDLIGLLREKHELLAAGDVAGLDAAQARATGLVDRLTACQDRRQNLLAGALGDGLPADSLQSLAAAVADGDAGKLDASFADTQRRTRLLQHQCLTNWVIVQRSLIHLSQMIEILATGGRLSPTYGTGYAAGDSGALVDRAV